MTLHWCRNSGGFYNYLHFRKCIISNHGHKSFLSNRSTQFKPPTRPLQWWIQDFPERGCPHINATHKRSCRKVIFLHMSVILFASWVYSSIHHRSLWVDIPLADTPLGQTPPLADTPWANSSLGRHPPDRHPPPMVNEGAVRILLEYILVWQFFSLSKTAWKWKKLLLTLIASRLLAE